MDADDVMTWVCFTLLGALLVLVYLGLI